MTNYRYLGYGVTDENGIAKLEYNSEGQKRDHSYTGVGAGEVDVVASLDNPVSSGSIVSEPCNVLDAIYYDEMDTDTHTRYTIGSASTLVHSTDKLVYTVGATSNNYIDLRNQSISKYQGKTIKLSCDVNIISSNQDFKVQARIAVNNDFAQGGTGAYGRTGEIYVDNIVVPSDATIINFRIQLNSQLSVGDIIEFDNWKIYPM